MSLLMVCSELCGSTLAVAIMSGMLLLQARLGYIELFSLEVIGCYCCC